MIFTPKLKQDVSIIINGCTIEIVKSFSYLGLIIDDNFKFKNHILSIASKVGRATGIIHSLQNILPISILRKLYFSLIFPYINLHILSWGGSNYSTLKPIIVSQNNAIRTMTKQALHLNTRSRYCDLQILTVQELYKLRLGEFMFNYNRNYNRLLADIDAEINWGHQYLTRRNSDFRLPYSRISVNKQYFLSNAIKLWSGLTNYIKSSPSIFAFKRRFTKYLQS